MKFALFDERKMAFLEVKFFGAYLIAVVDRSKWWVGLHSNSMTSCLAALAMSYAD